jgi:threonine dehydratase
MDEDDIARGVCAISSGNHGAALAYVAGLLSIEKAVIFVPETTPQPKIDKMQKFGAQVRLVGKNYDEAHLEGGKIIDSLGLTEVNPNEDPICVAGHGTIALEMLRAHPELEVILVPIGGGGMITGISIAAKTINPTIEIIGVQTESCPAMVKSIEDKTCYEYFDTEDSVCDALIGGVGQLPFSMAHTCIDRIIVVPEELIKAATRTMILEEKIVAEPSSAICHAAYLMEYETMKERHVGMVISGGNSSAEDLKDIIMQK